MKLIETYTYNGEGYNPFLIRDQWQVAVLNYAPEEALYAIDKLDIHYFTDEVFVLFDGHVVLITASIENGKVYFETILMKPSIVYNIPRNVWHKIAMNPGSSVLIVENQNTHIGDFEFYHLTDEQKKELRESVLSVSIK